MRLAHVSDIHLGMEGAAADPFEVAKAVVADLAAISDALDLVVVSGDLTEHARPDTFARFEAMFGTIGTPVVVVPGNHDGPAGFHHYSETSPVFADWNITNRVVELGSQVEI